MPVLLLVIGAALALFVLARLFQNADPRQIRLVMTTFGSLALTIVMLGLSMTGRLPLALAIVIGAVPIAWTWLRDKALKKRKSRKHITHKKQDDSTGS